MFEKLFLMARNSVYKLNAKIHRRINNIKEHLPLKIHYFEGGLYDAIASTAERFPYSIALEYADMQMTYNQLIRRIEKIAKSLKALGVKKGDLVTICMPNTPEEVEMFYAINMVGAVANMVHPLSSEKELEYCLNKAHSKVMLCIDITYPKIKNIIENTELEHVIVSSATKSMERITAFIYWLFKGRKIQIKGDPRVMLWNHFLSLSKKYDDDPYTYVDKNDPAVILYSGGTTGKSKGVVISNYSFNAQALQSRYVCDLLNPENSILTFLPNFHAFGIGICTHTPLYNGMRVVLIPQYNNKKFKSYLRKYKFNVLCGVPTLYDSLTKMKFRKNELSRLKLVVCGGDALPLELKKKVNSFLKSYGCKTDIRVGYGLTESSGVVSLSPEGILNSSDIIGYPFPDLNFKIIDIESGKEALIGHDGEICISGPNLMLEYLDDEEETRKTITIEKGKEPLLHTGDIGFIDKKGLLHYKSRLKRMIITSGYNVYPSNVEEVLNSHPSVERSAVIGVPNPSKGEIVKAYVILKEDKDSIFDKQSLQKHIKLHLARYEQPREIKYVKEFPLTKMGKIAYKELEKLD